MTPNPDRPLRILLVEDEEMNRSLFRAVLARSPDARVRESTIVEATTVAEARGLLDGEPVDLVFLDVRLPDGNGLDLAHEIAERPAERPPRVAILSASVLPVERSAAIDAGADAFLGKPYRPADLLGLMDLLVEGEAEEDSAAG